MNLPLDYLLKPNHHVILVHFETFSDFNCYSEALENIKHVGNCIGKFILEIMARTGIKDVHLITYSLGGHVANYIARSMRPYKLPRITALDPPALFVSDEDRLDASDAEFVDSFYTSAISMAQTRGHAGFFFNGGLVQLGCSFGEN